MLEVGVWMGVGCLCPLVRNFCFFISAFTTFFLRRLAAFIGIISIIGTITLSSYARTPRWQIQTQSAHKQRRDRKRVWERAREWSRSERTLIKNDVSHVLMPLERWKDRPLLIYMRNWPKTPSFLPKSRISFCYLVSVQSMPKVMLILKDNLR